MNEIVDNTDFRETYGNELIKDWYDWARMANPDVRLFYNEGVTNMPTWEKRHKDYLGYVKYLYENKIDTDAIGYAETEAKACFAVLHFSGGNLIDKDYEVRGVMAMGRIVKSI